jgi:hypothetical protein
VQVVRHQSQPHFYLLVRDGLVVIVGSLHHTKGKRQKCLCFASRVLDFCNFIQ